MFQNKSGSCVNIHGSSEFLLQHSEDVNCDNNNKKHNSGIKHSLPHSFHSVMRRTKLTDFFAVDNKRENTSDFDEEEDYFDSSVSFKSDEVDDMSEEQSDKKAENWVQRPPRAVALYPFQSENSETLEMTEGEEFFILEDDIEGWTKVRRRNQSVTNSKEIGYVPSSFIKYLL